jgi:glucosamine--fructose-6-phosphate aminotransferase (isomerizing)
VDDAEALSKGGFPHYMLKEIFEQPETIMNAMRGRFLLDEGTARLDGLNLVLPELRSIRALSLSPAARAGMRGSWANT